MEIQTTSLLNSLQKGCKKAPLLRLLVAVLLLETGLVGANISVPDVQASVDDPNLLGHLLQQAEIVGDHHHASVEGVDGVRHTVDHLHIGGVRGLVEEQQVGVLQRDLAEDQSGLEAVGQAADGLQVIVLRDAVVAHHGAPLLEAVCGILVLVLALDVVHRRLVEVQHLRAVLVEAADGQAGARADGALGGAVLATDQLQQRGLARAVGAHEHDSALGVDSEGDVLEQVILLETRVREGHLREGDQGRGQGTSVRELEAEERLLIGHGQQTVGLHLVEDFLALVSKVAGSSSSCFSYRSISRGASGPSSTSRCSIMASRRATSSFAELIT
eukprot:Colp12_sorted_trinity150504_noHs@1743